MSGYRLADGTLSTDYKEGQAFKFQFTPEQSDELSSYWSKISLNGTLKLHEDDGTKCPRFECIETGEIFYEEWIYLAPKQSNSQQTYTQSELSYIESLEDEVAKLEELCSDYTKIIAEKDAEIFQLKHQSLRVASETVLDITREFKPISEMTIDDWHQAMNDCAVFEDEDGYTLTLEQIDPDGTLYFVESVYVYEPNGECMVGDSVVSKRVK